MQTSFITAGRRIALRMLLLCALVLPGVAQPARAQPASPAVAGVSVDFPAPPRNRAAPGQPVYWVAESGSGAQRRVIVLAELVIQGWVHRFARTAPDVLITEGHEQMAAQVGAGLDGVGGADVDVAPAEVGGYPGVWIELERRDVARPWVNAEGKPTVFDGLQHIGGYAVIVDGRFVLVLMGSSQPVTADDAFFKTLRTPQPAPPRDDVQSQWNRVERIVGLLMLLALALVVGTVLGVVVLVRRQRRRRAAGQAAGGRGAPGTSEPPGTPPGA